MRYGSICSGIEAATVAWKPLGFEAAWFSEIEPFPCQLLEQKYPGVPNYGDMTSLKDRILSGEVEATDIVCGGTPCQAFSVAGKRESLDDDRGNLSLEFCNIVDAIDEVRIKHGKPQTIVFWENVPGVLSTKDNAFGCFLGKLVGANSPLQTDTGRWTNCGYVAGTKRKAAWRVLDAQYFGVPQRRRRVFVVASAREDFDPSKVLFEQTSLRGDYSESLGERKDVTASANGRTRENSERVGTLIAGYGRCYNSLQCTDQLVVEQAVFREGGFGEFCESKVGGTVKASGGCLGGGSETLVTNNLNNIQGSCYDMAHTCDVIREEKVFPTLTARMGTGGNQVPLVLSEQEDTVKARITAFVNSRVRKLTPVECERLQGFPDNYTRIAYRGKKEEDCPDSPRYKAIGNSWAVPVVRWLGKRIKNIVSHE